MDTKLNKLCRELVPQILAQRGWKLVQDEAAFIEEVVAETQARQAKMRPTQRQRRSIEKIVEDATVNRYSHLWYAACADNGTFRQRQAFEELHRYLYPIALYRAKHDQHIAEECAQEALISVWQNLGQVKDPGSFPRWAGVIVSNQVNQKLEVQARQRREISESDLQRDDSKADEFVIQPTPAGANQPEPNLADDIRVRIEAVIRYCLRRSRLQQQVIIQLFLERKPFKEVADELGQTLANLYVLKSRALAGLRKCRNFLEAVEELL